MSTRVLAVTGISGSGKTTTVEAIIRELRKRRYSVGSVKDIHFEDFAMDTVGTNTHRHYQAGAEIVTAAGMYETDVLYKRKLPIREILSHYSQDFVILEGVMDPTIPRIITAHPDCEIDELIDGPVFAIAGRVASSICDHEELPVFDARRQAEDLVDLIESVIGPPLPGVPAECCSACGYSCAELTKRILRGQSTHADCPVVTAPRVRLRIGDEQIPMVPFVQAILENAVRGVARELDGYREGASLSVKIDGRGCFEVDGA